MFREGKIDEDTVDCPRFVAFKDASREHSSSSFNLGQLTKRIHGESDEFDEEEARQAQRKDRRRRAPFYLESPIGFTFTWNRPLCAVLMLLGGGGGGGGSLCIVCSRKNSDMIFFLYNVPSSLPCLQLSGHADAQRCFCSKALCGKHALHQSNNSILLYSVNVAWMNFALAPVTSTSLLFFFVSFQYIRYVMSLMWLGFFFLFSLNTSNLSHKRRGLCAERHGIQISMEAILAGHPALCTEWLDWVAKWCELWRIRTDPRLFLFYFDVDESDTVC